MAGNMADKFGRKKSLILACILGVVGPLIQSIASSGQEEMSVMFICVGRVILGLGMGTSMMVSQV